MKQETLVEHSTASMLPMPSTIVEIRPEANQVFTLVLTAPPEFTQHHFEPGQFNMLLLPGHGEVAISISSDAERSGTIGHTIRAAGTVTRAIERLCVGDQLGLRGPYGAAWPMKEIEGKDVLFVAGGIGLAPLRPAILHVIAHRERYGKVTLLYGGKTPADLLYGYEFEAWRKAGIEIIVSVDRGDEQWTGLVGVVPMNFYRIRPDARKTAVLTCGPEIMMHFVICEALARRIPKSQIYVSLERNMKCGYGVCGHCQLGPLFICKDGPVFPYPVIEPYFGKENF